MKTVYQVLCHSVNRYAGQPFLHIPYEACSSYSSSVIDLSYQQLLDRVEQQKQRYQRAAYGCGHRVAIVLENRPDFFVHWYALNALGVSVVPVNAEMTTDEIAYFLEHSECCLVVSIPEKLTAVAAAITRAQLPLPLFDVAGDHDLPVASGAVQTGTLGGDTECALLYTSGSTGKPKGCVLNNDYFIDAGQWYMDMEGICTVEEGQERLLTPLPLVHMNAMACSSMAMLMSGGCLIQLDRFHPRSWWRIVRESRATIIHYLGVMPAILLNSPADENDRNHRVKFGFGAGINPRHHGPFEQRFTIPLVEAWAMTESGCSNAIIASNEPRHIGTSCIGRASAAIEIQLIDEQGHEVDTGEPGELLVRAAGDNPRRGFFTEYLKNPEATAEAWQGGYLHTGDVVREGDDGQLHFVDRRKNVIRRSGENISALEVEAALSEHPLITQVAVAAVPDEIRGDEVMAVIVLRPEVKTGAGLDHSFADDKERAQQIFQHCYVALAYYKAPGYIAFVDKLPLTPSQKPRRAELKTLCRDLVAAGDCIDLRDQKRRHNKNIGAKI